MYYFRPQAPEDISARALVLSLLATVNADAQPIARLVDAGRLFGIEPSTLRVAVTRMTQAGLVESPERGVYVAGPKARGLNRRAREWQGVAKRTRPWTGEWLVALTHHLGRTDRKQLRARERALALAGYRETGEAFWVRPANLAQDVEDHRTRLIDTGADEAIRILQVSATAPEASDWTALWSTKALEKSYAEAIEAMSESLVRLPTLPAPDAARESLLIGQAVIRLINFDPLLPPELGNQAYFLKMVEAMKRYNEAGRACWNAYYAEREQAH